MKNPISKNAHGMIDYAYGITLPLLPEIVGFKKNKNAKILFRTVGGIVLGYSSITRARWGLIKLLPFKTHLVLDLTINCVLIAGPWLLGFSGNQKARTTTLITCALGIAVTLLTDQDPQAYKEQQYLFI